MDSFERDLPLANDYLTLVSLLLELSPSKTIIKLLERVGDCTITLTNEDSSMVYKVVRVSSHVLYKKSQYFRNMFESSMLEAQTKQITISTSNCKAFRRILHYFHTNRIDLKDSNAVELLICCDQYGFDDLKTRVESYLVDIVSDPHCSCSAAENLLRVAERANANRLEIQSSKQLMKHFVIGLANNDIDFVERIEKTYPKVSKSVYSDKYMICQLLSDCIFKQHLHSIDKLLQCAGPSFVNQVIVEGGTPIMLAIKLNYSDVISHLIKAGADVNQSNDLSAHQNYHRRRHRRINANDEYEFSLSPESDKDSGDEDSRIQGHQEWNPLLLAIEFDHVRIIEQLIAAGADIEVQQKDDHEKTPLMIAADEGNLQLLSLLSENGVQVNKSNSNGWTALHFAVCKGNQQVVEKLLQMGSQDSPAQYYFFYGVPLEKIKDRTKIMARDIAADLHYKEIVKILRKQKKIESRVK